MERDYRRPYSYKFYSGYEVPFRRYSSSSTTFSERAFSVKTGSSNWCSNRRDARAGSFEGYSNKFVSSVFTVPRRFTLNLKVRNLTLLDLRLYYRYDKPLFSAEYFLSFHFYHSLNYNIFLLVAIQQGIGEEETFYDDKSVPGAKDFGGGTLGHLDRFTSR